LYTAIRDRSEFKKCKKYIEELWSFYHHLSDQHFLSDAKSHFVERLWEMYLAKALSNSNHKISSGGSTGPDFKINFHSTTFWVEATAPGSGSGNDAVPDLAINQVNDVPEEQIMLRLSNSITNKVAKWRQWYPKIKRTGNNVFVIAINTCKIESIQFDYEPPFIVKVLYSIGPQKMSIDKITLKVTSTSYNKRSELKKKSGATVNSSLFLTKEYSDISAIIYTNHNMLSPSFIEGSDFRIIHNINAKKPLPDDFFKLGWEYRVINGEIRTKRRDCHQ